MASSHHQLGRNHDEPPSLGAFAAGGACGATPPGTCNPVSWEARAAGSVVKAFVFVSHEIAPLANFWVTTPPSSVWSAVGAPSAPVAPPSFVHAAFMAPRTMMAPKSGVQKITG